MIRFFTWHEVKVFFDECRALWPVGWNDVQVYSDEVIIYYNPQKNNQEIDKKYLKNSLTKNYNVSENKILIDFTQEYLDVFFEVDEEGCKQERQYTPLFKEIYIRNSKPEKDTGKLPGARILAFHSYKGGVGRTLSLISLLRECAVKYENKKIMVIDADLEAPGLTWMLEGGKNTSISYLDALSVMHFEKVTDMVIMKMAELLKMSTLTVTTDKINVEHYFMPVYREKKQVMDIFSSPEKILLTQDNKFHITDTISRLGAALGVDLILVDLRAGITEYSAPYLFDPRVEKFYVTSTSMQSIKGLNQILEQIYGKTKTELLNSKVFLTMIPPTMGEGQKQEIEDQILQDIEKQFDLENSTFLRENYIIHFPFEDALVHIGDFQSICRVLQGKQISRYMGELADELFAFERENTGNFEEKEARSILEQLNTIANEEVTAEGSNNANMLVTSSIKALAKNFKTVLPRIVIPGAKGSGKTYIYKQLLSAKTWGGFEHFVEEFESAMSTVAYILPLVASLNVKNLKKLVDECIENIELDDFTIKSNQINDNFKQLQTYSDRIEPLTQSEWTENWIEIMLSPFRDKFSHLSELDQYLEEQQKKIIFIVDGLEDIFMNAQNDKKGNWKYAIRAICQHIINELDNLDYGNIGIIVFARTDMLDDAIDMNNEQFKNLYQKFELNWSQTEALRLALWLAAKAYPELAKNINILTASKEVIVEKLTRLWGLKLGKGDSREAFSDRWILAALSDFTGQLQARDIVRFLKYSTQSYQEMKFIYDDRLIMPIEIRNAMEPCSKDKLVEIKTEMKAIHSILEKFLKIEPENKLLPLTLDKIDLTGEEIDRLESQGYLKISDKKYYLPEIIRLALGYKYERGARPKVLSLLVH